MTMFFDRAVDGMLPLAGDLRDIRDETFLVDQDESGDKANLRNRLSIQSPADEGIAGVHGDRHKLGENLPGSNF